MANPNLNTSSSVLANNASVTLTATTETLLLSNPANSGKVLIIDSIVVANYAAAAAAITVTFYPNAATNTGGGFRMCSNVNVAVNSSLYVLNKSLGMCIKEGQSLYVTASVANALTINVFFKEFS